LFRDRDLSTAIGSDSIVREEYVRFVITGKNVAEDPSLPGLYLFRSTMETWCEVRLFPPKIANFKRNVLAQWTKEKIRAGSKGESGDTSIGSCETR
jgi:hypothetical protein